MSSETSPEVQIVEFEFDELSVRQLHDVLQLRCDVFVVEQECVYPEVDGKDPGALHVLATVDGELAAYLRVLTEHGVLHIGRVVTAPAHRGHGLAAKLVEHVVSRRPGHRWELEAQAHLVSWYERFDFAAISEPFDLDGIPHVQMRRLPDPDAEDFDYDEFALFTDNTVDAGLPAPGDVPVRRITHDLADGRQLSALHFGGDPQVVFVHGTAQNAHTWDTVVLAMGPERGMLCIDLPGHGHSSWRDDKAYDVGSLAADVVELVRSSTSQPVVLVGMSLGGLVATRVAATAPELVRRLVTVDITPGVTREKAKHIHEFVAGPQTFDTFGVLLDRTRQFNPTRSVSSLHRGILHNASRQADGSWAWRYDRRGRDGEGSPVGDLWPDVEALEMPHLLVRGGADGSVVDDADVEELRRRRPESRVVLVEGAGHSVQGDRPVELAELLLAELDA